MRSIEWRGTLTARTSIAHGGKDSGTVHTFRRETLLLPDGRRLPAVPVISGGVVRGPMRRLAAKMAQHAITNGANGDGRLPFPVVHALRTGGALRESRGSEEILTGEKQAILRDTIPMLGIFGLSAGSRVMSGRLDVDKPLPVAKETAYLADFYQVDLADYDPPSVWELIQRETYTRFADVNDSAAQPFIEPLQDGDTLPKGSGQMLWSQETLPAGTRLFHSLVLRDATPVEQSFMTELMTRWADQARIGAQSARGMGQVTCDYTRSVYDILGDTAEDEPADWRQHTADNADQVQEVLGWL